MVFTVPRPEAPRARLRLIQPGLSERVLELDGRTVTLGRATDNGLVLVDGRVSRHHGRISVRRGTLVYTDLRSTNGSRVNGTAVDEVVLGVGDRIEVGDTLLVIETVEPGGNAVGV
jgi:pSer/pThr/pTyr-binding forkhead associated (FHA) protein